MKVKAGVNIDGASLVVLAGQEWFIPLLAVRQNRVVVPRLRQLIPLMGVAAHDPASGPMSRECIAANDELMSEALIGDILVALHAALTRAYDISFEEFLDLPISPQEWVRALGVVIQQTAFFKAAPGGGQAAAPGEDQGTTETST